MKKIKKIFSVILVMLALSVPFIYASEVSSFEVQGATSIATPKLVSAKASGTSKIRITWEKVSGVKGYIVYRKTDKTGWKKIKAVSNYKTVSYTDSKLSPGTRYYYTVRAYKTSGTKNVYGKYNAKGVCTVTGLGTPKIMKIDYANTTGMVDITWNKISGAQYYEIYYKRPGNKSWEMLDKSKKTTASVCTITGEQWSYTLRACTKISGKIYRSGYDKKGKAFTYEEYGNPNIDYSVFDIIDPSKTSIELNVGEREYIDIECDLDELTLQDKDEEVVNSKWEKATDSNFRLSVYAVSKGRTTVKIYSKKYPYIYKNITVNVKENVSDDGVIMAAIGIQSAYNSAKFPSTLHVRNISFERSLINGYGDNIARAVIHTYAGNSLGGYGDIYAVVLRSKTNEHYPNAFEYEGYYYSTSTHTKGPGMSGERVSNREAVEMWKYLYDKNIEIPYD